MASILKQLSEANAVSGDEGAVRTIILKEIKNFADNVQIDSIGSIIALKRGQSSKKKLVVTANIDEPGFIVSSITDKGYLKFKAVGSIDPRKIISKKVVIGKNSIKGVIGMKAIHLQTKSEREKVVAVSKLFIDIGAKDKAEAEGQVSLGDYITFDAQFAEIGKNVKGKALDRSGACAALCEAMRHSYPYDVYFCFLAQSEVGARGARIAAHRLEPDAVLTVSAAETTDMYGCENENSGAVLGEGIAINYSDKNTIFDRKLTDAMKSAAFGANINIQEKTLRHESGDGGAIQYNALGAKSIGAAIPCRYSHSPVSLMNTGDIDAMAAYVKLFLSKIGDMI